ncbi:MAG: ATP synthase subunit I [Gammaproteobacteria bacterium]
MQSGTLAVAAVLFSLYRGSDFVMALLYGGAVTIVTTLYSGWRLKVATSGDEHGPGLNMTEFYKGALLRFILVIALLALGLGVFRLEPVAVIIGFAITQTGYLFGRGYAPRRRG